MSDKIKIMVTGHRPDKLWGYDLSISQYRQLKDRIKNKILKIVGKNPFVMISGMALGVDTLFAELALELKSDYDVKLFCAIPCKGQDKYWQPKCKEKYKELVAKADSVYFVSDSYSPNCMQKRNQFMVNLCDYAIAVWDGSKGGTSDTVKRIKKSGKPLEIISPFPKSNALF